MAELVRHPAMRASGTDVMRAAEIMQMHAACSQLVLRWMTVIGADLNRNHATVQRIMHMLVSATPERARWACAVVDSAIVGLQLARNGDNKLSMQVLQSLRNDEANRAYSRLLVRHLSRPSPQPSPAVQEPLRSAIPSGEPFQRLPRPASGETDSTQMHEPTDLQVRQQAVAEESSVTAPWRTHPEGKQRDSSPNVRGARDAAAWCENVVPV